MATKSVTTNTDDLNANTNLKRIDDLEQFKKGFEGKALDDKIRNAISESVPLQNEIRDRVVAFLCNDQGVKEGVKKLIKDADKESLWRIAKQFTTLAGWVISLIVAGFIGFFFQK